MADNTLNNVAYSVRRHFVDRFFIGLATKGYFDDNQIIDIGGQKTVKRGHFNIANYNHNVTYVNIDDGVAPDYHCSGDQIPVADHSFDVAILAETLEHVLNPEDFIKEAARVIKPGGTLILSTPFIYHVHADPCDYGRYTSFWYQEVLMKHGFDDLNITPQGGFYACVVQMVRLWLHDQTMSPKRYQRVLYRWVHRLLLPLLKVLLKRDNISKDGLIYRGYTTGYGVVARKAS